MSEGWLKRHSPLTCTLMPENLTHGYKKKSSKNSKKQFVYLKIQSGSKKELILLINSVLEDILIYHLRLEGNFVFFWKKKFQKIASINFVGPDPTLLEIGAKWRTHWALKLKIKKKRCQRAGSRGTAFWPVPICQKIWHMGTKKNHQKQQKTVFLFKKFNQEVEKSWSC